MLQDLNKSFPPRTSHTKTLVKDSILFDYIKSRPYLTTPNSYCEDFEISNVNLKKFISPKVFAKIQYDSFEITISIHQRPGEKTIKVKISSDSNNSNGVYMLGHCIRCYDGTLDYDTVREFLLRTIAMASCQSAESSVSGFFLI